MRIHRFTSTTLVLSWVFSSVLLCARGASDAWPQWRGPLANGVAPTADPPIRWSETENVAWKVRLPGVGSGTPIVWGDQVFIQAAVATGRKVEAAVEAKPSAQIALPQVAGQVQPQDGNGPRRRPPGGRGEKPTEIHRFTLLALDRVSGKLLWEKTLREEVPHEGHHRDHGYASHSPVTDGERIYAWLGSRGLHCFDMGGALKWQKDLGRLRTANGFGEGNSPALYGDVLVINWDHEGDDFIAAFDKKTGRELWRNPRDEKTTWTTPYMEVARC